MSTQAQGAVGAETKTAGQIAFQAFRDLNGKGLATLWCTVPGHERVGWERAAAASVRAACAPWGYYIGEPPGDDSPLSGVFVAGMDYTERLLAKLLNVTDYEGGDGSEDFDSDATQTLRNILTGAGLWDADDNRHADLATPRTDSDERTAGEDGEAQGAWIKIDVQTMQTSAGADYYVRFTCGDRSVTPYMFKERYKSEYEAAHFEWVFGLRPDKPDLMAYDETSHPNLPAPPSSGQEGR